MKRECERGGQFTIKRRKIRAKRILLKPQFLSVYQVIIHEQYIGLHVCQRCVLGTNDFTAEYSAVKFNKNASNSVGNNL